MFRVAFSPDFPRTESGELRFDFGFRTLEGVPDLELSVLPGEPARELSAGQLTGVDALLLWAARLTDEALVSADRLRLVARVGVGYDNVDIEACTRRAIAVTITPDGVRRPMAASTMLFVLALAHRLVRKDQITRSGQWSENWNNLGTGLTGRALGLLGAGNIGREVFRLAKPFEMRQIAFDPYVEAEVAAAEGFELVELETLLTDSDFLCILCPLNDETRGMINADRLALMKPTAYLVSIARGPIVDEAALIAALRGHRIAGAGLDVFEQEPADPSNPLFELDNVIVTPHSVAHTDECLRLMGESACENVLAIKEGRTPSHVVNPAALQQPPLPTQAR
jgi:phosphoglycerate dehydrogenase-like enzyme